MISKELLSKVLKESVLSIRPYIEDDTVHKNIIMYECGKNTYGLIGIYELAHECKQWALNYMVDKEIQSTGCIISSWIHTGGKGHARILVIDENFIADTEPEAIIKACEWIMENKCGS